jgi:tetratricopeptide (TPR) repeat protein
MAPRPPAREAVPTPPPMKRSVFQRALGAPVAERASKRTEIAGSGEIPALDEIGSGGGDDGFGVIDMALPDGVGAFAESFGDADLPMPSEQADLPMPVAPAPRGRPPQPMGTLQMEMDVDADLPAPAFRRRDPLADPEHDLPVPARRPPPPRPPTPAFDDDLPMLAEHGDLPMPAADADLPVAVGHADLPMPARYADLPMASHHGDLPMPARYGDLPAPARYGDLPAAARYGDLPLPSSHGDLPAPARYGDLPIPSAHDNLPIPARYGDLPIPADQDLPLLHSLGDLPIPADQDLPLPSAHGDLPIPADQDLPLPSAMGDLPLPADFNYPTRKGEFDTIALDDDLPPPPDQGGAHPEHAFLRDGEFPTEGEEGFGELASVPPRPIAPPRREGSGVGDEFAIDQVDADPGAGLAEPGLPGEAPAPRVKIRRKATALRLAIALIPLLALGGGLLSLTPLGPYGAYAISDALNAESNLNAVTAFRDAAQGELDADTAAGAEALLARAKNEQAQMPRYTPMAAYTAYLAFMQVVRFGNDSEAMALGKHLLDENAEATGEWIALAKAARSAAEKQWSAAEQEGNAALGGLPGDIDAAVLAAEIALGAGRGKEAVAAWKRADGQRRSARTLFGLARAQLAVDDRAGAKKSAEEVLKLSKNHVGARALIAEVLWLANAKDPQALKLLEEITEAGVVKAGASKTELVTALALIGGIHLSLAKITLAEKAFKEALEIDPDSERALIGNGELFYVAGRYSEAIARFTRAKEVNPQSLTAALGIAKSKIKLERSKEARTELAELAKSNKHPLVGYWLGQAAEALGDRKAAEAAYRDAIKNNEKHADAVTAYVALADLLTARGDTAEASKILADASTKLADSVELHNAKGDFAMKAGRLDEAKAEFRAALKLEPHNSLSRFRLAATLRRAREFAEAQRELDVVAEADPSFPGLMLERGLLYEATGDTEKALSMYNEALKKAPDDLDLKLRIGSTQVISGNPKQALVLLQDVIAKRPRSAEVNHFYGRARLFTDAEPREALQHLQLAVQLDPNRAEYFLYVAIAANQIPDLNTASEAVDKALALDQNYGEAYWQKGVILQKSGKTRDALDVLDIAIKKNPTLHEAYAAMARCYQDQSDYAAAEQAWRKAIEGNDRVAEWHFRLGKILVDKGAKEEATPHLLKAVDLIPEKPWPAWLWNANLLLAEGLRESDPKRALKAYQDFMKLTNSENAYREEAAQAIKDIERQLRESGG